MTPPVAGPPSTVPAGPEPGSRKPLRRALRTLPAVLWMAAIFFSSSSRSITEALPEFQQSDKVAHAAVYGILAALYLFAFAPIAPHRRGRVFLWVIALTALYGATDELHQAYVPGRYCAFADWIANAAGGIAVASGWFLAAGSRRRTT